MPRPPSPTTTTAGSDTSSSAAAPSLLRALTTPITAEAARRALATPITAEGTLKLLTTPLTGRTQGKTVASVSPTPTGAEATKADIRVKFDRRLLPPEAAHDEERALLARAQTAAEEHGFRRIQVQILDEPFCGRQGVLTIRVAQGTFSYSVWIPLGLRKENYPDHLVERRHEYLLLEVPGPLRLAFGEAAEQLTRASLWNTPSRLVTAPNGAQIAPWSGADG